MATGPLSQQCSRPITRSKTNYIKYMLKCYQNLEFTNNLEKQSIQPPEVDSYKLVVSTRVPNYMYTDVLPLILRSRMTCRTDCSAFT